MNILKTKKNILKVSEFSKELALRKNADTFFLKINKFDFESIVLDFSQIKYMSRSFAHQYCLNKQKSKKMIIEKNLPVNIKKMLAVVRSATPEEIRFSYDEWQFKDKLPA